MESRTENAGSGQGKQIHLMGTTPHAPRPNASSTRAPRLQGSRGQPPAMTRTKDLDGMAFAHRLAKCQRPNRHGFPLWLELPPRYPLRSLLPSALCQACFNYISRQGDASLGAIAAFIRQKGFSKVRHMSAPRLPRVGPEPCCHIRRT